MSDQIEIFGASLVQHGKDNDRAYLMKVARRDCPAVIDFASALAAEHGYSKIFAKAPAFARPAFLADGFEQEAKVPLLFNAAEDGYFLSKFLQPERRLESEPEQVEQVLAAARSKFTATAAVPALTGDLQWRIMQPADVSAMARLYRVVFASYPFPIDEPDYLAKTMAEDVIYHGIWQGDELVALSSAEIDFAARNVEMTDFATRPDFRGRGLATFLLEQMEADVAKRGIHCAYTIARAYSFGMNITFAKHGYQYAGTLTNNTQISGQLESMNVWYKIL